MWRIKVHIILYLNKKSTYGFITIINMGKTIQIIEKLQYPDRRTGKCRQNNFIVSYVLTDNYP